MWITLLVMAVAVSFEPFRIGMTVLMLNRPRPLLQLLAFLSGGFAMGVTVGLVVLFVVRSAVSPTQFTLPRVQVVIGVLALLIAAVLAVWPARPRPDGDRLSAWARRLADGRSLWVRAVAGLGIALPSVDYLAVLAVIAASGAEPATQIGALLTFNAVAVAFILPSASLQMMTAHPLARLGSPDLSYVAAMMTLCLRPLRLAPVVAL